MTTPRDIIRAGYDSLNSNGSGNPAVDADLGITQPEDFLRIAEEVARKKRGLQAEMLGDRALELVVESPTPVAETSESGLPTALETRIKEYRDSGRAAQSAARREARRTSGTGH